MDPLSRFSRLRLIKPVLFSLCLTVLTVEVGIGVRGAKGRKTKRTWVEGGHKK